MVCGLGAVLISRMLLWPRRRAHFHQKSSCGLGAVPIYKNQEFWPKLPMWCLLVCGLGAVPIFPETELWPRRRAHFQNAVSGLGAVPISRKTSCGISMFHNTFESVKQFKMLGVLKAPEQKRAQPLSTISTSIYTWKLTNTTRINKTKYYWLYC